MFGRPLQEKHLGKTSSNSGERSASLPPMSQAPPHLSVSWPTRQWKEPATLAKPQINGYNIVSCLGAGGMGTVWRAVQLSTKRPVAIKVMDAAAYGPLSKYQAQFKREVELAARLDHPNIARVYEAGTGQGVYYYAMQLIEGVALDRFVIERRLSNRQALVLMLHVCRAVQHAHQRGVIHRDLKPSNIIVSEDGKPHIVDFGLAKPTAQKDEHSCFSVDGDFVGTLAYMSPEQAAGKNKLIDTRTDTYSLGVILYRLLTREFPHDLEGSTYEVQRRIVEEEVRQPSRVCRGIDPELEALLYGALAKKPDDRYASVADMASDIESYLEGEPLSVRRPTLVYFLRKRLWKHRVAAVISIFTITGALGLILAGYLSERELRRGAEQSLKIAQALSLHTARVSKLAGEAIEKANSHEAKAKLAKRRFEQSTIAAREYRRVAKLERHASQENSRLAQQNHEQLQAIKYKLQQAGVSAGQHRQQWAIEATQRAQRETQARRVQTYARKLAVSESAYLQGDLQRAWRTLSSTDPQLRRWEWDRLRGLLSPDRAVVSALDAYAASVAFVPGTDLVVSCGSTRTVSLWNLQNAQQGLVFEGHRQAVTAVAASPSGDWVASASKDTTVKLWNTQNGGEAKTLYGHRYPVYAVAFSPDGKTIATGSGDHTVRLWDTKSGKELNVLHGHQGAVLSVAFTPDGTALASVGMDQTLKIWLVRDGTGVFSLNDHKSVLHAVAFSPDGKTIATGGADHTIGLWSVAQNGVRHVVSLAGHRGPVTSVAFSPDATVLASASTDATLKIWDSASGKEINTFFADTPPQTGGVNALAFSTDAKHLATASGDRTVKIWDLDLLRDSVDLMGHHGAVTYAAYTPDGQRIISGGADGSLVVWETDSRSELARFEGHAAPIRAVAFPSSAHHIASLDTDGVVEIWNADSGHLVLTPSMDGPKARSLAYTPDGKVLIVGDEYGSIRFWDSSTNKWSIAGSGHNGAVDSLAVSNDGRWLVSGGGDGCVLVWDLVHATKPMRITGHTGSVTSVAISAQSGQVASASEDQTVKIWDLSTGLELAACQGHQGPVRSVRFSPDGDRLVTGGQDGTLRLWDVESGIEVASLSGHRGPTHAVAFSPTGDRIVSGGEDSTIKIWRANSIRNTDTTGD